MITSGTNAQIKNLVRLQKSGKTRREQGVFIAEGLRLFREIPMEQIVKAYVTEEFLEKNEALIQKVDYEVVAQNVLKEAADTKTPQGILAVVKQCVHQTEELLKQESPCLLVLENVQDPGNLGTMIRTAEGAGVQGILISEDTVDIYNPKVIRSTMGSIFRVPFVVMSMEEILKFLREHHITSYAAHLDGKDFYEEDYKKACAFFIGNEGNGLTDKTSKQTDRKIKIPMYGKVESLNAAIAATVLMYEAMRQRR